MFRKQINTEQRARNSRLIQDVCDEVEIKNLAIVCNRIESSSMHNNYHLVKAATLFVREHLQEFDEPCTKRNFISNFIEYLQSKANKFESVNYDPDGVGAGTITDIINRMKKNI